ncbi:hypothetical protein GMRT_15074 [Giardia muris]|uniref:Uncharacterized protein n=1 Tax=Giardia muris TaxID=5742 RepID=A0A4Z1T1U9_GIAMU|nr:hypothetical protein GMRT_15074 [Giardia muris]|eukprot:TNJ26947.1 hypothetical protein GMRT_15074 [Giardia muris]
MAGQALLDLLEAGSRRELGLTLLYVGRYETARAFYLAISRLFDSTHPDEHLFSGQFVNTTRFVVGGNTVVLMFVTIQTLAELREQRETCRSLLLNKDLFHVFIALDSEVYGRTCMEALEASSILAALWAEVKEQMTLYQAFLVALRQFIHEEALKQFTKLPVSMDSEGYLTLPITYLVSNLSTLKGEPTFPINPREGFLGLHYLSTRFGCDIISLSNPAVTSAIPRGDGADLVPITPDVTGGIDAVLEGMLMAINEATPAKAVASLRDAMERIKRGIPWHPLGYSLIKNVMISIMLTLGIQPSTINELFIELFQYMRAHISPAETQQPLFLPSGWLMPSAILTDLQALTTQAQVDLKVTWELSTIQYKQLLMLLLQGLPDKQKLLEVSSPVDPTHASVVATEALYRSEFEAAMREAMDYASTQAPMEPPFNPPQGGSTLALSHIQSIDASIDVQHQQPHSFLSGSSLFSRSRVPIARSRHAVTFMDPTSSSTDPVSESA